MVDKCHEANRNIIVEAGLKKNGFARTNDRSNCHTNNELVQGENR
jgi:hypothetical protein